MNTPQRPPESAARSARAHIARMRARLAAGAGSSIAAAEAAELGHHLNGVEAALGVLTSPHGPAQAAVAGVPDGRNPAYFSDGVHLSPAGRVRMDALCEQGCSAAVAAKKMSISETAALRHRRRWLRQHAASLAAAA